MLTKAYGIFAKKLQVKTFTCFVPPPTPRQKKKEEEETTQNQMLAIEIFKFSDFR